MKMFVFEYIAQVSDRYHQEGGLMVVAENLDHAKEIISNTSDVGVTEKEWSDVVIYELKGNPEPKVFVFPDAGCC